MPPAIIGGVIAGTGAVASSVIGASAAHSAASQAAQAAAANNALQKEIYDSNVKLAQPYITGGNTAETALQGFLGLGGDPAATSKAFNDYLNSTGYQFTRSQGIDAAEQSASAKGLLNSGAALKALDTYGTGLAGTYGQKYIENLQGLTDTGQRAAGSLTGAGQSYANAVGANNTNASNASANAGLAGAAAANGAIGKAVNAFEALRGQSSYGAGAPNAFTGVPYFNGGYGG